MIKNIAENIKKGFNIIIKDKKKLLLVVGIFILLVVIILVMVFGGNELFGSVSNADGEKFKAEYEALNGTLSDDGNTYLDVEISSDNVMKYSNVSQVLSIFEKDRDAVIYFGYASCAYCRSAAEVLCDVSSDTEIDTIYYLDAEGIKDDDKYNRLLDILGEKFVTNNNGDRELDVPLVIFVVNGEIVSYNKGTIFSQYDPYTELDEYQIQGLGEIYSYGINDVLEGMK